MAKSKSTTTRKRQPSKKQLDQKYPIGIMFVDVAGIREHGDDEDHVISHRIRHDEAFLLRVCWEYSAKQPDWNGSTEQFEASFTSEQLFEFAAKSGLLITSTSRKEKVARGIAAALRRIEKEDAA